MIMGWCSAGSSGEQCDRQSCEQVGGSYSETGPGRVCEGSRLVPDTFARELVDTVVWPPINKLRDEVLPDRQAGARMVQDFDRHFAEIVAIMGRDRGLILEVVRYSAAMAPYLRALAGQSVPADGSLSRHSSERLRPGMVEWTADILRRFSTSASPALKATIGRYAESLPSFQNLTPVELLSTLDDRRTLARLQG